MFTKEVSEGEEAPEPTEEEAEQGPEPLSTLDKDAEVEGGEAWTPLFSSTNSGVKNQVDHPACYSTQTSRHPDLKYAPLWRQTAADVAKLRVVVIV